LGKVVGRESLQWLRCVRRVAPFCNEARGPRTYGHCYAVLGETINGVELYNPRGPAAPTPDPQVVPWSTIAEDGDTFFFDN
jgi:hypothetical protein